ncbi:MAG: DNA polymerase/3'-5' exonuclease PolX [Acidobacteria bacterium]|nr:DNA polymerase/3'-5' exonuclease PolX [Acidobacteriota bacterium]
MEKREVVKILSEISTLLELKGENPFKSRSYSNAARVLEGTPDDLAALTSDDRLEGLKGIGEGIGKKIRELATTGTLVYYEELKSGFPPGILEMLRIPNLGPKRVKILYEKLDVKSVAELEYACNENRLLTLPGFGEKSQDNILKGIELVRRSSNQFLFSDAWEEAEPLLEALRASRKVAEASVAGSLRRRKEVVKDIDIVAASEHPEDVMDLFCTHTSVDEVLEKGSTKSNVRLKCGIAVDLRIVPVEAYPFLLHHMTGSKNHNIAMRSRAQKMGLKMSEWGLFDKSGRSMACRDEKEIFAALGLDEIQPEMREDMGEIEAAEEHALPALISREDLAGVLHCHTHYSDGISTVEEMVKRAAELGFAYIGISDHSQSAGYAGGLKEADLQKQWKEIEQVQRKYPSIRILKGTESDILVDGSLDYPDAILRKFDFVVASIHSRFNMDEDEMTARILKAIENPYTTIVGHPTGRLLLGRDPFKVNIDKMLTAARKRGVAIELNANPQRLDLDWRFLKKAKEMKVAITINPDAHSVHGISDVEYGCGIARKGWLEAGDVLNTKDAAELTRFAEAHRGHS